ncbi:MAG: hypothetical protein HFI45_18220 [Lachnospiraceae bacterium]|nr:hypothetical protein [Lachnospiraceae bacterium]MDE7007439.1 hypothetical protein [Lachnospiraceae bacterium]
MAEVLQAIYWYYTKNAVRGIPLFSIMGKGLAIHEDIAKVLADVRSISGKEPE